MTPKQKVLHRLFRRRKLPVRYKAGLLYRLSVKPPRKPYIPTTAE